MERNKSLRAAVAIWALSLTLSPASPARTLYVDDDAPAGFKTIQAAIDAAVDGDTIIVHPGTYTGPGNRDISFQGKAITVQGVDPNDWSIVRRTVIDCQGTPEEPHRGFLFTTGEGPNSVLSGVRITGGHAPSISLEIFKRFVGGGICCNRSSPSIIRCIVGENFAEHGGGGLFAYNGNLTIRHCEFRSNTNTQVGTGAIEIYGGQAVVANCSVTGNYGDHCGGVYYNGLSTLYMENCLIRRNESRSNGAGVHIAFSGDVQILNCTIMENHDESMWGAGIYIANNRGTIRLTNCIVWGNSCSGIRGQDTQVAWYNGRRIDYCCIEGWDGKLPGAGSFGKDPLLTRDAHLRAGSPCIDAGDPNSNNVPASRDTDGEKRVHGSRADIGCDEFIDTDGDDLADAWERCHFADLASADATGNPDDDPWDNGSEYVRSSNPLHPPTTYYVDPVHGRNGWDGLSASWDGAHGPQATIHAALEQAEAHDLDRIVLMPGVYTGEGNCNNDFGGKELAIRSTDPNDPAVVAATVIDCNGTHPLRFIPNYSIATAAFARDRPMGAKPQRAWVLRSGEGADASIEGVTMINGAAGSCGGAVLCEWSSPRIIKCVFRNNESAERGGAIYCRNGSAAIERCTLERNRAGYGGAIACSSLDGRPRIVHCVIQDNVAELSGGGLDCGRDVMVSTCLVVRNRAEGGQKVPRDFRYPFGGGGIFLRGGGATLLNCTISGNSAAHGSGLLGGCTRRLELVTLERCIVWGNSGGETSHVAFSHCCQGCVIDEGPVGLWAHQSCVEGVPDLSPTVYGGYFPYIEDADCTHADPRFVSLENSDYHLQADSPCRDVGPSSLPGQLAATDLDGASRLADSDGDGIAQIDMGVYESRAPSGTFLILSPQSVRFQGYDSAPPTEPQKLTVKSRGTGGLSWSVQCDCPWLAVSPLSGEAGTDVVLRVKDMELPVGTYHCEFLIHAPAAANSPMCVPVELQMGRTLRVPESYPTIQAVLDAADSGDMIVLADGLYAGAGNREIILPAKTLYIRSMRGPEACIIDCERYLGFIMPNGGADITCEGLTLRHARCGVLASNSRVRLVNCHVAYCDYGCKAESSQLSVEACRFSDGGTAVMASACDAKVLNTIVTSNTMGMAFWSSQVVVRDTRISQNTGSGLSMTSCFAVAMDHCLIADNGRSDYGSRAIDLAGSPGVIRNCTIVGNVNWWEGSETAPLLADDAKVVQVVNSILWNNQRTAEDLFAQCVIRFSDVQGGWPGEGNINADPLFASPGFWNPGTGRGRGTWTGGDYHLKSQTGRRDPVGMAWVVDEVTSPCIDAGDPNGPIGNEPEPNGGRVNMGAYGGTAEASKSYFLP